ncbi:acyltransferase [Vibrio sp. SM6]|uniref:Acyltransferase n=1 Tax=Vibrio agarilyticus TaxID=2726741 RepID=A0A7X8TPX9_9VIBR|nr:acyltransferase [Vibrio agarilyticus]NLS12481.1 acyltransferase [Vibrio agarilyticus]
MTTDKTVWVDYVKGIGIILVVLGHVIRGLDSAGLDIPYFKEVDTVIYSFHMPLFFFISGMFFTQSFNKRGAKGLTFTKIDILVYPYVVWSLLQGSIEVLLSAYTNGDVSMLRVLSLWSPRAQFWFLHVLFIIFALSSLIFYLSGKRGALVLSAFSFGLFFLQNIPSVSPNFEYLYHQFSNHFIYFTLGILYVQVTNNKVMTPLKLPFTFALSLFLLVQYVLLSEWSYTSALWFKLTVGIISIAFVIKLAQLFDALRFTAIYLIGIASMEIYLIHILTGSGARVALFKLGVEQVYVHILIGTAMGILIPMAFKSVCQFFGVKYLYSAPISRLFSRQIETKQAQP